MKVLIFLAALSSICIATDYRHVSSHKQTYPVTYAPSYQNVYSNARPYSDFAYRVRDDYINKHGYGEHTSDVRGYNADNNYRAPYSETNYPDYKNDFAYVNKAPANSGFSYRVNKDDHTKRGYSSGYNGGQVDFGHNEKKSGDRTTGSYDVVLPDGRRQIVTYYVDGSSGFVADVRYEPAYKSTYESTYESTTLPSYRRA